MQYSWYNTIKKRGEFMKKIIIVMMCLLMCGCSNKSSIEISKSMDDIEMNEGIEK